MKAAVDDDQCRGHGVCWSLCPEVFDLTSDGYAVVRDPESQVAAESEAAARNAERSCPERAITLS
jgi:ferredoxin